MDQPGDQPGEVVRRSNSSSTAVLVISEVRRSPPAARVAAEFAALGLEVRVVLVDDRFGDVSATWQRSSPAKAAQKVEWVSGPALLGVDRVANAFAFDVPSDAGRRLTPAIITTRLLANSGSERVERLLVATDRVSVPVIAHSDHPLLQWASSVQTNQLGLIRVRTALPETDGRLPDAADLLEFGFHQRDVLVVGADAADLIGWWETNITPPPLESTDRLDRLHQPWLDWIAHSQPLRVRVGQPDLLRSFRNLDEHNPNHDLVDTSVSTEGYCLDRPWALSDATGGWPRVLLSEFPQLIDRLHEFEQPDPLWAESPYTRLASGHRFDEAARRAWRAATSFANRGGGQHPPNPFRDTDGFTQWLAECDHQGVSRHLRSLLELRSDVQDSMGHDLGALRIWAIEDGPHEGITLPLVRSESVRSESVRSESVGSGQVPRLSSPLPSHAITPGCNVIGLLTAQLGVGEQSRLVLDALDRSGVPLSLVESHDTVHTQDPTSVDDTLPVGFRHDVDVIAVNADQLGSMLRAYNRLTPTHPTISVWAWETPMFPDRFHDALQLTDHVWTVSKFAADAITAAAAGTRANVSVLPVRLPYVEQFTPSDAWRSMLSSLDIDDKRAYFSFMYDYSSLAERKQPWLLIEAFRRAFPVQTSSGPQLVLKSMNREFFPLEHERVLYAARGRSDIHMLTGYLPRDQRKSLIAGSAAYVSLHRSEGFGLTMAEAMGAGVPVIGTGWSGNMEFMNDANSWLVRHELVDIPPEVPHYGGWGQWAQPDVNHAAELMRHVIDNQPAARAKTAQALADLSARNASDAAAVEVLATLRSVRQRHSDR
jgi:glycosyltransferase involved in cell wall biosynthesis